MHRSPMPSCGVHLPTCLHEQSSLHLRFLAKAMTKSLAPQLRAGGFVRARV